MQTNSLQNSKKEVSIKKVTFNELWKNYPPKEYEHNANTINEYCAIHVSITLMKSGITLKSFEGVSCWGCPTNEKQAIRAEELTNWLNDKPFAGCPKTEKFKRAEFRRKLGGRTGIVFFKDYWQ